MFDKKKYAKQYYKENQEKLKERSRKWYYKNKDRAIKRIKEYKKKYSKTKQGRIVSRRVEKHYKVTHPWVKTYRTIRSRCLANPFYIKKGIKCFITVRELKKLWFRDKPYLMKRPTIDRKDNKKHYTFDNCKYIEFAENLKNRLFCKQK